MVVTGVAKTDSFDHFGERAFLLHPAHLQIGGEWRPWAGPRLLVVSEAPAAAGEVVAVGGRARPAAGISRGQPYAGWIRADQVTVAGDVNALAGGGNWIRQRVAGVVQPASEPAAALLVGFLIGDTSGLTDEDMESVRRAGLAHLVAVSGSNVALFLAGWWVVTAPLTMGPRRRLAAGFVGLALFVVATRWEPSVLRAAAMAGVLLAGRLAGFIVTPWIALAIAVSGLLLISPELAVQVGFQLSVAATAGVVAGARSWGHRRPRWLWVGLGASLGAQAAVSPLLLAHFDRIPLLTPITNLVAVPAAGAATLLGGVGALVGSDLMIGAALIPSRIVLGLARLVDDAPQLDLVGLALAGACGGLVAVRALRPLAVAVAGLLVLLQFLPPAPVDHPTVVFLDVGQGDATLLLSADGHAVVVDGGPPRAGLVRALRRRGIGHVSLVVATHGDLDHIGGLHELVGELPVTAFWHPPIHQDQDPLRELGDRFQERGSIVNSPAVGDLVRIGDFLIEVLGPLRRYAGDNDGSLVMRIEAGDSTLLMAGDVEAVAQADLVSGPVDVVLVPHHGSATSDPGWLASLSPGIAVVSVGDNDFGHPDPSIIEDLRRAGAQVRRTDQEGDVVLRMEHRP
jgi:competence protein ComEC